MIDIQWLIGGEAGYGIMTTGLMMSKIFTRLGLSVFDYVEYPSLIRGGHNAYYVRAADEVIFSQKRPVDILVALNKQTVDLHKDELRENAAVIFDPTIVQVTEQDFPKKVHLMPVPLLEITKKVGADRLMINTVSVGASLALFSETYDVLEQIMKDTFGRKGEAIVGINVGTSKGGFDFVKEQYKGRFDTQVQAHEQTHLLLGGGEAVAFGAIKAGLKFAAIYPMTPINTVMTTVTAHALKYGIVVKEPEDEIAGLNMAIGASYAGVRALAATSGGGFSLMTEALGLAAQTETPVVIIMGMRPGPATGMPTWTEQGDLRFVMHAHQGDFPRIIVAPGDAYEAYAQTMDAFNLAEKYQLPVIVLVDKYLMEGHMTTPLASMQQKAEAYTIVRGKIMTDAEATAQTDYKRYLYTDDGVSPRSLPGQQGGIALSGSDEHDERGLYNEESEVRTKMMDKRFQKLATAIADGMFPPPELYGDKEADLTLVSFGSTKMPILDAMRILLKEGKKINFIKVSYIDPFPTEAFTQMMKITKKTLVIENNKTGQFEGVIREKTGITFEHNLRKYDGRPFYPEEIVEKIKTLI